MNSKLIDINEKGIGLAQFNVMQLLSPTESMNLMIGNIKAIGFFVTATYEQQSVTNKAPVVVVSQFQSMADIFESARSMSSYNDNDAPETTKDGECFCNRDFKESEIKELVKYLKGRESIWEGYKNAPCNIDDKSFATLTKELNTMFKKYQINHCAQKLHFLTQACHETDTFTLSEETTGSYASSQSFYKGRGILQLTGVRKDGEDYYDLPGPYETYSNYTGINAVKAPNIIAEQVKYCIDSGGWMFSVFKKMPSDPNADLFNKRWKGHKENTIGKTLNELALFGDKYLELISALLNGRNPKDDMPNGWSKRKMNYDLLKTGFFNYDFYHNKKQEIEKTKSNGKWHDPVDNPRCTLYMQSGGGPDDGGNRWGFFGKVRNDTWHHGLDLFAKPGENIYACVKGEITNIEVQGGYGNVIILKILDKETFIKQKKDYLLKYSKKGEEKKLGDFNENEDISLFYAHLKNVKPFTKGQIVEAGTILGETGVSGVKKKDGTIGTKAPHLHFEIRNSGTKKRINPGYFISFKNYDTQSKQEKEEQKKVAEDKYTAGLIGDGNVKFK